MPPTRRSIGSVWGGTGVSALVSSGAHPPRGERLWHAVLSATLAAMKGLQDQSSIRRMRTAQIYPRSWLLTLLARNRSCSDLAADS